MSEPLHIDNDEMIRVLTLLQRSDTWEDELERLGLGASQADKFATSQTTPEPSQTPVCYGSSDTFGGEGAVYPSPRTSTPSPDYITLARRFPTLFKAPSSPTPSPSPSSVEKSPGADLDTGEIAAAAPTDTAIRHVQAQLKRLHRDMPARHRRPSMPARWRDHTQVEKLHRAGDALTVAQNGIAFTLNLSAKVQATLRQHDDPVRVLSGYISRELRCVGLDRPAFGFAFDLSDTEKLHVHGLMECPAGQDMEKVKDALRRAGGSFPAQARARQVKIKPISTGWVWINYSVKGGKAVADWFGSEVQPFMSRALVQVARERVERVQAVAGRRKAAQAVHVRAEVMEAAQASTGAVQVRPATCPAQPVPAPPMSRWIAHTASRLMELVRGRFPVSIQAMLPRPQPP